jgi:hypothetical protein
MQKQQISKSQSASEISVLMLSYRKRVMITAYEIVKVCVCICMCLYMYVNFDKYSLHFAHFFPCHAQWINFKTTFVSNHNEIWL